MIFEKLVKVISDYNGCDADSITLDTAFEDLGIDSLDTVELMMNLEEEIGEEIELEEPVKTVGELVDYIEKKLAE